MAQEVSGFFMLSVGRTGQTWIDLILGFVFLDIKRYDPSPPPLSFILRELQATTNAAGWMMMMLVKTHRWSLSYLGKISSQIAVVFGVFFSKDDPS